MEQKTFFCSNLNSADDSPKTGKNEFGVRWRFSAVPPPFLQSSTIVHTYDLIIPKENLEVVSPVPLFIIVIKKNKLKKHFLVNKLLLHVSKKVLLDNYEVCPIS